MIDLYNGDCLEIMKQIPSKSVDFIGIELDKEYFKIAKDRICEES